MKKTPLGSVSVTASQGGCGYRLFLVCAFLVALAGLSVHGAPEVTYKLLGREVGGYTAQDNLPEIITKELGPRAKLADWMEIKKQYGQSETALKSFCEKVGLNTNESAWVSVNGHTVWQEGRHYFAYRADHQRPDDFMLHDQLQNNFLLLGSWLDARPALVKYTEYNDEDAAKWAKRDEMLAAQAKATAAKSKEVAGVYTLVSVNEKNVPTTIDHEGQKLQIRSGVFTILADGHCRSKMTFVPPNGQEATVEVTATYRLSGPNLEQLKMQWVGAGTTSGTVQSNTFTMENEGMMLRYRK